jgi:hypothetical protein
LAAFLCAGVIPSLDVRRRKHMNRMKRVVAVAAMSVVAVTNLHAQEIDLRNAAKRMRQNQEELRQYSWKMKMTFLVNDELRRSDTFTVRYVMGGMVEKMQIDSEVADTKVRWPNGKKLKKKELEAAQEFIIEVKNQLDGYLNPLFAEKAVATANVLKGDGTILLISQDVMNSGDTVEITLNEATHKPLSAKIKAAIEGTPVSLDMTFGSIEYGPNHPKRSITTSEWQGFKLSIITENSNYQSGGI